MWKNRKMQFLNITGGIFCLSQLENLFATITDNFCQWRSKIKATYEIKSLDFYE